MTGKLELLLTPKFDSRESPRAVTVNLAPERLWDEEEKGFVNILWVFNYSGAAGEVVVAGESPLEVWYVRVGAAVDEVMIG
nr:hypothetical protein Itr_chr02CG08490 [Ipomoea trifida]